jgi:hypothetical protein
LLENAVVANDTSGPVDFATVLEAELEQIDRRRQQRGLIEPAAAYATAPGLSGLASAQKKARARKLVGLAFSGGGIRSATFNLGVLQGLAGLGLLPIFDYLSTVSGGGYIGAWLAAWMRRSRAAAVESELQPERARQTAAAAAGDQELDPIRHLRRHSNYLAPRQGFLSIDRWVLWSIYLRNFLLNQLVLLSAALLVLLLSRLLMIFYYPTVDATGGMLGPTGERLTPAPHWLILLFLLIIALGALALRNTLRAVHNLRYREGLARQVSGPPKQPEWLLLRVLLPLGLLAILFCFFAPYPPVISTFLRQHLLSQDPRSPKLHWPWWIVDLGFFMALAAIVLAAFYRRSASGRYSYSRIVLWSCVILGLALGAILFGIYHLIYWFYDWDGSEPLMGVQIAATALMVTLGPPLIFLALVLGLSLGAGMLGNAIQEELREWFASLSARLLLASAAWVSVNLVALYATPLVLWAGPWTQAILASGWLLTLAGGVLAGSSARTGAQQSPNIYREWLARLSLPVFVVGIFVLISLLLQVVLDNRPTIDLAYEGISPYVYQPANPPMRVSVLRTGASGTVSTERTKEYLRIPNEAATVRQQYWLGMLNTERHRDISNMFIKIEEADLWALEHSSIPEKEILRGRLTPLQYERRHWQPDEFAKELNRLLPDREQTTKQKIVDLAHGKGWINKNHFYFETSFLKDLPNLMHPLLSKLQFRYDDWKLETFRAELDRQWPEASKQTKDKISNLVQQKGQNGEDECGEPLFHFQIAFLQGTTVLDELQHCVRPVDFDCTEAISPLDDLLRQEVLRRLEPLQWQHRVWEIEALQDELDRVFPEAHHLKTKRLVLQRLNATGAIIQVNTPKLLGKILLGVALCLGLVSLAARWVDVNVFSLYSLYGNRLVRAYLGASRPSRHPDPVTQLDFEDDLDLAELKNGAAKPYDGPFLIVNTAMNLVHTRELAWQQRKAESFVLTPLYCGSDTSGYRLTNDGVEKYAGGVQLGGAVTISGAAASPNMGYHSSPAVTFLLTVFNARLGAWLAILRTKRPGHTQVPATAYSTCSVNSSAGPTNQVLMSTYLTAVTSRTWACTNW